MTAKDPNYVNQTGFDAGVVNAAGILASGSKSTTLTTVGENTSVSNASYEPQVFTLAVDLHDPDVTTTKSASDLTSSDGNVRPGDILQYSVEVQNNGGDAAAGAHDSGVSTGHDVEFVSFRIGQADPAATVVVQGTQLRGA